MAAGMFWQVGWSLVLGFAISAAIQALVSKEQMRRSLGRSGLREVALATLFGAASSSCSYAAAAVSKTLFKKGAGLVPSLAFLFSSTNLVIELGVILYLLMGWQFTLAEWVGGLVLIAMMSLLVKLTYPTRLVEMARTHVEAVSGGHDHGDMTVEGDNLWQKLRNPQTKVLVAQNFVMDWSMLWKDLVAGFLIAGVLSAFVPVAVWHRIFLTGAPPVLQVPANAVIGPLIAVVSFVCSIGNVPLAAILWASGISFGGVLAFLYADLIVLPLLDVYRRYYGLRMAAYIGVIFFVTMVLSGILMELVFAGLHQIPVPKPNIRVDMTTFSLNYTFWLNVIFAALAVYFIYVDRRNPMQHDMHHHPEHAHEGLSGQSPAHEH
ncbi:MAG: permease [Candidatus Eremiobacteraeota bacterium]|nr:permease [Candidatus Eremiobacteraeota bacterium]MBC5808743.1 permease [Candidatus Eremiobacteraeota bacterium]